MNNNSMVCFEQQPKTFLPHPGLHLKLWVRFYINTFSEELACRIPRKSLHTAKATDAQVIIEVPDYIHPEAVRSFLDRVVDRDRLFALEVNTKLYPVLVRQVKQWVLDRELAAEHGLLHVHEEIVKAKEARKAGFKRHGIPLKRAHEYDHTNYGQAYHEYEIRLLGASDGLRGECVHQDGTPYDTAVLFPPLALKAPAKHPAHSGIFARFTLCDLSVSFLDTGLIRPYMGSLFFPMESEPKVKVPFSGQLSLTVEIPSQVEWRAVLYVFHKLKGSKMLSPKQEQSAHTFARYLLHEVIRHLTTETLAAQIGATEVCKAVKQAHSICAEATKQFPSFHFNFDPDFYLGYSTKHFEGVEFVDKDGNTIDTSHLDRLVDKVK